MRTSRWPSPPLPGGFGFPLGFAAGLLVIVAAILTGTTSHPIWTLIVLSMVVAGVSTVTTARAALATVGVCWALYSGFELGGQGQLVFTTAAMRAAVVLVLTACAVLVVAATVRAARTWLLVRTRDQLAVVIPTPRSAQLTSAVREISP